MGWRTVRLGEVLSQRKEFIIIEDETTYSRCRVQTAARGVVLRDRVPGSYVRTKRQQVCREGDFLVAEIDAKAGGYGTVPPELDGAIVSSHYFLFEVDENSLCGKFLDWYCRTPHFLEQVSARGSTNYAAIRASQVLSYVIPFPPLGDQIRIVAELDRFARQIERSRRLIEAVNRDIRAMLSGAFHKVIQGAPRRPMAEVAPLVRRPVEVHPDHSYLEMGVRSFGRGTFHKPSIEGTTVGTKRLFLVRQGDLLFNNVFAWEGAVAVARNVDDGRVGSHRFLTRVPDIRVVTSSFLYFYFLTREGLDQLGDASPGGAGRNRTLGLRKLDAIRVPIPSIDRQLWFHRLRACVSEMDVQRTAAVGEMDALTATVLRVAFSGGA